MRRKQWFALAAAVGVALCGLPLGLFMDDYLMVLSIEGKIPFGGPLDLFRFGDGDVAATRAKMDLGPLPWYTAPDVKAHFFRPLSCALMQVDHALFGRHAVFYHLHSLAWYLALVVGVMLLYRRSLSAGIAVLALFLFAVDDAHWFAAVWWANRNALIGTVPALWGLLGYLRWREEGWRPGLPLGLAGFGLGLLGGETALGVVAYLAAYELFGPQPMLATPLADWRRRCAGLLPLGVLGIVYIVHYKLAGYGAHASEVYIDPMASPGEYLWSLPSRMALLGAAHFFGLPSELAVFAPKWYVPLSLASAGLLVGAAVVLRRIWASLEQGDRVAMRWLLAGSVLSLLPVCATFPASRLLLVPSIGGGAALALLIRAGWRNAAATRGMRALAVFLVVLHLGIAPIIWPVQTALIRTLANQVEAAIDTMEIAPAEGRDREVVLLSSGDPIIGFYALVHRTYCGQPLPDSVRALSMAAFDLRVTRTAPNALQIRVTNGELLTTLFEQLLRDSRKPLKPGDTIAMTGMRVTVNEVGESGPKRFTVDWDRPLEDPRYAFLAWDGKGLHRVSLPALGASIDIPHQRAVLH